VLGQPQARPADAVQQPDGLYTRPVTRYRPDGTSYQATSLVCEDCWEPMPPYLGASAGWVSPESASKLRTTQIEGKAGIEAIPKIVCLDCYKAAFLRTHVAGSVVPASLDGRLAE
jgi:hypothetical protein